MAKAWEDLPEECWEAILDRIKFTQDHHLESISLFSISNRLRPTLNVSMRTVLLAPDDLRLTALDLSNQIDVCKRLKITIGGRNKKKSLAELKEEENNMLLEKVDLHKKLEEWKTNYDELSRRNLSLKEKLKMHLESQPSGMNIDAAASSPLPMAFPHPPSSNAAASSPLTMALPHPSSSNAAAASPEKVAVAVPPIKVVGASSQLPMALPYSWSIEATAAAPEGVMVGVASSSSQAVASSSSRKARLPDLNMIPEPEE